jgi:hypothetical protein
LMMELFPTPLSPKITMFLEDIVNGPSTAVLQYWVSSERGHDGALTIIANAFLLAGWTIFDESDDSTDSDTYVTATMTRCTTNVTTCNANMRLDITTLFR